MLIKKKVLLLTLLCLMGIGSVWGDNEAVYCWLGGKNICYRLSDRPVITYEDGAVVLSIDGVEQLRLPEEYVPQLTITYGIYQDAPTDIEQMTTTSDVQPVRQVGKYIYGGRLIIVKDGKMYDAQGRVIVD